MRPKTPELTVDAIIELDDGSVVLVERRNFPAGWAIPGGFVDPGESPADAVRREALEETSLEVTVREIFHVYTAPPRESPGEGTTHAPQGRSARRRCRNGSPSTTGPCCRISSTGRGQERGLRSRSDRA
jgi:ADP-ribose pyrophosphatase YjhB (NUDIX family)